jgi:CheY-like chemotaxis protein
MKAQRILLVDDETALTFVFRLMLESTGRFEVREECSAERALATAQEFHPDLILLDKGLTEKSGEQVAAELQTDAQTCGTQIAYITGGVTKEEAAEAIGLPTLSKPVSPGELVSFVDRLLSMPCAA